MTASVPKVPTHINSPTTGTVEGLLCAGAKIVNYLARPCSSHISKPAFEVMEMHPDKKINRLNGVFFYFFNNTLRLESKSCFGNASYRLGILFLPKHRSLKHVRIVS